ncbi:uncharacterized protein LOC143256044 [Tachypleus tridentatus]|uniref:uncharacterized protein LOC143256044 n=1 Tax=Tachypleus tridentatus TaxID=6853 RepID=UPI003FD65C3F
MRRVLILMLSTFLYTFPTKAVSVHFDNNSEKITSSRNDTPFGIWAEDENGFGFGGLIIDKIMDLFQITYRNYEVTVSITGMEMGDNSSVPITTTMVANATEESSTGIPHAVETDDVMLNMTLQNSTELKVVTKQSSREPRLLDNEQEVLTKRSSSEQSSTEPVLHNEQKSEDYISNTTLYEYNTTTSSSMTLEVNVTKELTTATPDVACLPVCNYIVCLICTIILTLTS